MAKFNLLHEISLQGHLYKTIKYLSINLKYFIFLKSYSQDKSANEMTKRLLVRKIFFMETSMKFYDIRPLFMTFYDKISKIQCFMALYDIMTE